MNVFGRQWKNVEIINLLVYEYKILSKCFPNIESNTPEKSISVVLYSEYSQDWF